MPARKKNAQTDTVLENTAVIPENQEVGVSATEPVIAPVVEKTVDVPRTSLANRIPKGLDIGMVVYVRFAKGADVQAERVKAITIRETNVGIMLQSGREINAAEIGHIVFLDEKDVK